MQTIRDLIRDTTVKREAQRAEVDAKRQSELEQYRDRNSTMTDKVKRVIAAMPPEERDQPRKIAWFREKLKGRRGGPCHPGELGVALAKLGFERRRSWALNAPRGCLWYPPSNVDNL